MSEHWENEDLAMARRVKALEERGFMQRVEAVSVLQTLTNRAKLDVERQLAITPHDRQMDTCEALAKVLVPLLPNFSSGYQVDVMTRWFRKLDAS